MSGRKSILPGEATTVQLASLVGLSTRSIREWASRGVMVRGTKPGRYRTIESIHNYVAFLEKGAEAAATSSSRKLAEAKAHTANLDRRIRAIKLAQIENEVLTLDELDKVWTHISAAMNRAITSVPAAARAALPHLTDHDECTMMRVIGGILVDLAKRAEDMPGVKDTKEFGVLSDD